MALMTIGEVSKKLGVSARMLRYYEKEGLIKSIRKEGCDYRMYDESTVSRISQILALRRLSFPLKKIAVIIDGGRQDVLRILEEQLAAAEREYSSMRLIREVLYKMSELVKSEKSDILPKKIISYITKLLPAEKYRLNGGAKLFAPEKENQIRIVLLPSCTVASYRHYGENPEDAVGDVMDRFIRSEGLYLKKPDSRLFGFNPPGYEDKNGSHCYENCVTVPDGMNVPAPLSKKTLTGGLFAAYTIDFPDFFEWEFLKARIKNSSRYQADFAGSSNENTRCCLEEHLNWVYSSHMGWPADGIDGKVDLLLPIKPK